jgi:flotillin
MDYYQQVGIGLGLGVFGVLLLIIFVKANMVLCQPNELVVIAGRRRKRDDGTSVGYRLLRGGRGLKLPLIESVARLPLTTLPIHIELKKAMSAGMIPLHVEGRANVKLAGREENGVEEAIERFLGKGPDAVIKTAQQALEGALRGVLATVSPEDANADRLALAQRAADAARKDLHRLGIVLDYFQIHDLSDQHGYLEAIGRKRTALVHRDAAIAEATADAEARQVAAEQKLAGRGAEIASDTEITTKENALSVHRANLAAKTNQAEQRAGVAGDIARVEAQVELHTQRVTLAEKRELADVVEPAKARRAAHLLDAQGKAAKIRENGKATADAVETMRAQWEDGDARDLFLIQMMPHLVHHVTGVVKDNLRVDKLTILDGGTGEGVPNYVKNLTNSAVTMLEQVKNATGLDLAKLAEGDKKVAPSLPKELD